MKKLLLPLFIFCFGALHAQKIERIRAVSTHTFVEYAPTVSADGKTMVFQSNNNPYKAWFLYESTRLKSGRWSAPEPIESINTFGQRPTEVNGFQTDFIATPCLSANGKTLLFSATFRGGKGGRDIYYARKINGNWTRPVNMGKVINSKGHDDCPAISADGQRLYFARPLKDKKEGQRCYKLFVARKNKRGYWQAPHPLPYPINTGCEKCPRIMSDNATLLFASIRKGGKGGFDLYKAVLDIEGKEWVELKALEFLNTPKSEEFATLTLPDNALYFTTQGKRNDDIFRTKKLPTYMQLKQNIGVVGVATSAKTRQPIATNILVKLQRNGQAIAGKHAPRQGFRLVLRQGYQYELVISAEGYQTAYQKVDLRDWQKPWLKLDKIVMKPQEVLVAKAHAAPQHLPKKAIGEALLVDVKTGEVISKADEAKALANTTKLARHRPENLRPLESLKAYKKLIFSHLLFDYNSAKLDDKTLGYLQTIAQLLKKEPQLKLEISAHTDNHGTHDDNMNLSKQRAQAVKEFLVKAGVDVKRLSAKGYGETRPLVPNTTVANRERNRRVELKVL
ncbi:OmpA family protein [Microscilla marina]|uniref:Peptidoglycan-associated cytoplasmic membrane protein, putative n=1 Tax=Microscilla marina ATCC 23134 TaxID=313606 RepID=A1ZTL4_MICM2|nr:OmpA family protein [Microscilla marina]EAY26274.1 peptidoglycan-associated cytoplasmic membrane protein, putative [Microscilla marina ATCC 23134]